MSIIQGSNEPIVILLETDISDSEDIIVSISSRTPNRCLKHWHKNDIAFDTLELDGKTWYSLTCPCSQADTFSFPKGDAYVDMRYLKDDVVYFMETIPETIIHSTCKEPFMEGSEE